MKARIPRGHNPAPLLKKCHVHEPKRTDDPSVTKGIDEYNEIVVDNESEIYYHNTLTQRTD